jgi:hypothetical protein
MDSRDADAAVREQLVDLLERGNAHMTFEEAVREYPMASINTPFPNGTYGAWHLLEHLRITQWDILDFVRNPAYEEREWPADYWPAPESRGSAEQWAATIEAFLRDRKALRDIVTDAGTDLHARIPHGTGQTILREILVVADHNAYHIGELAIMRQVMGTWGPGHDRGAP